MIFIFLVFIFEVIYVVIKIICPYYYQVISKVVKSFIRNIDELLNIVYSQLHSI
jgi:hypothetical protein